MWFLIVEIGSNGWVWFIIWDLGYGFGDSILVIL